MSELRDQAIDTARRMSEEGPEEIEDRSPWRDDVFGDSDELAEDDVFEYETGEELLRKLHGRRFDGIATRSSGAKGGSK